MLAADLGAQVPASAVPPSVGWLLCRPRHHATRRGYFFEGHPVVHVSGWVRGGFQRVRAPNPATPDPRRASARPPEACVVISVGVVASGRGGPVNRPRQGQGFGQSSTWRWVCEWSFAHVLPSGGQTKYCGKNPVYIMSEVQVSLTYAIISVQKSVKTPPAGDFGAFRCPF